MLDCKGSGSLNISFHETACGVLFASAQLCVSGTNGQLWRDLLQKLIAAKLASCTANRANQLTEAISRRYVSIKKLQNHLGTAAGLHRPRRQHRATVCKCSVGVCQRAVNLATSTTMCGAEAEQLEDNANIFTMKYDPVSPKSLNKVKSVN